MIVRTCVHLAICWNIRESASTRKSDNLSGADNQQGRSLTGSPQRLHAGLRSDADDDIVRASQRCEEVRRNDEPTDVLTNAGVTLLSEIPCRVSSDLHEWRNDLGTVSMGG